MTKIAVFSSGKGTTFKHLAEHFKAKNFNASIDLLVTDREGIGAIDIACNLNIPSVVAKKSNFTTDEHLQVYILSELQKHQINFIVLAGYLKKISPTILCNFENKIINTHPSLLPKYGGKGMYGKKIHQEVIKNSDPEAGATIHFVNSEYDKGAIIDQQSIPVETSDTAITIEQKIKALEKTLLIKTLEDLI